MKCETPPSPPKCEGIMHMPPSCSSAPASRWNALKHNTLRSPSARLVRSQSRQRWPASAPDFCNENVQSSFRLKNALTGGRSTCPQNPPLHGIHGATVQAVGSMNTRSEFSSDEAYRLAKAAEALKQMKKAILHIIATALFGAIWCCAIFRLPASPEASKSAQLIYKYLFGGMLPLSFATQVLYDFTFNLSVWLCYAHPFAAVVLCQIIFGIAAQVGFTALAMMLLLRNYGLA